MKRRSLLLLICGVLVGCAAKGEANRPLVAMGTISADALDATGQDTLGGVFSGMATDPGSWSCHGTICEGILYGMADRGFGDGTQDYHPRIEVFHCRIDQERGTVALTNTSAIILRSADGQVYSGLESSRRRLDPEGLVRLPGGEFLLCEEYGPAIMRFDAEGKWRETLPVPPVYAGRRANRGWEGLTLTPDGKKLVAILQSPLLQDGGAENDSINTRLLVFEDHKPVAEYVYQLSLNGNESKTRHTPVSEILAVNEHQFLVIERGGAHYKRIVLADTNGATNILERREPLPKQKLPPDVTPVRKQDFIDMLDREQLGRIGLSPTMLSEKWEGLALVPVGGDEYLLLVGNDNDFLARHVIHNGTTVGANAKPVDTMLLVYRITLPK